MGKKSDETKNETKKEEPKKEEPKEPEEPEEPEEEDPEVIPAETDALPEKSPGNELDLTDEQLDKQGEAKQAAVEAMEDGDMKKALDKYTEAIKIGNVSAMMYTKRADMLLKSKRPLACIADCDAALEINPDSAKAFRLRGKAHRKLGHYEEAHKDISVAQKLDFDDDLCEMQQFVAKRWTKISEKQNRQRARQERIDQKKKMADMKRRKEQAQREYE